VDKNGHPHYIGNIEMENGNQFYLKLFNSPNGGEAGASGKPKPDLFGRVELVRYTQKVL
jgi:hypothetical protein